MKPVGIRADWRGGGLCRRRPSIFFKNPHESKLRALGIRLNPYKLKVTLFLYSWNSLTVGSFSFLLSLRVASMAVDMNMNILIVDDYKTMLRIIENLLKQLGFKNVHQATDGTAALKLLREVPCGLRLEHAADDRLAVAEGSALGRKIEGDAFHHDHRRKQNGKRHRR
jgi:hypothetical protein